MNTKEQMTGEDLLLELEAQQTNLASIESPVVPISISPYTGIAAEAFSCEAIEILMHPVADHDVEIRPDGLVYLPEIKFRRILNRAFGPGAWSVLPLEIRISEHENMLYYRGALFVHGRFVSEAIGEQQYFASNDRMSYATAAESAKSNCLTRCCKDLGIASELWDPAFVRRWIATYAIEVWCENVSQNPGEKGKKKRLWRKKEAQPIAMYPWRETKELQPLESPLPTSTLGKDFNGKPAIRQTATSATISVRQAKRFSAIASEYGWSRVECSQLLNQYGYTTAESISRKDYDQLCSQLENMELRARLRSASQEREIRQSLAA